MLKPTQYSLVSSYIEDIISEFNHAPDEQGPQRDEHIGQFHGGESLQLSAEGEAEGQFEQHCDEVPGFFLDVLGAVARVEARLAASGHLHNEHN